MKFAIDANAESIKQIQTEYSNSIYPWYIGFSGGKDSSAVLKLVFLSLVLLQNPQKPITVIYCDTGVDIPIIDDLVRKTLLDIQTEAKENDLPIFTRIVTPPTKEKFFSKVIGKGYPAPTNIFRWCTRRLRTEPIKDFLASVNGEEKVVLLGIRKGESTERDRTLSEYKTDSSSYYRQSEDRSVRIFAPIINYSTEDVWATVAYNPIPKSIDAIRLMSLYRQASGECPIIRDPKGTPCGKGRFGCWTCTVVRKDRSITNLVNEGYENLKPLLDFRNWLIIIRDDPSYRCSMRRNGTNGPGPFTIKARKEILKRLLDSQQKSGYQLIDDLQIEYINQCWEEDKSLVI
jgi:DNA sulfur modification protein DndC